MLANWFAANWFVPTIRFAEFAAALFSARVYVLSVQGLSDKPQDMLTPGSGGTAPTLARSRSIRVTATAPSIGRTEPLREHYQTVLDNGTDLLPII